MVLMCLCWFSLGNVLQLELHGQPTFWNLVLDVGAAAFTVYLTARTIRRAADRSASGASSDGYIRNGWLIALGTGSARSAATHRRKNDERAPTARDGDLCALQ